MNDKDEQQIRTLMKLKIVSDMMKSEELRSAYSQMMTVITEVYFLHKDGKLPDDMEETTEAMDDLIQNNSDSLHEVAQIFAEVLTTLLIKARQNHKGPLPKTKEEMLLRTAEMKALLNSKKGGDKPKDKLQ